MLKSKNQNIEFKQEYVQDICKEVIAFANAEGGAVFVGVRKDGVVLGINDSDEVMLKIVNSLKDAIVPDVMPSFQSKLLRWKESMLLKLIFPQEPTVPTISEIKD